MTDSTTKICRTCKNEIDILLFARSKKFKSGYDTICLECARKKSAKYRRENPEKIRKDKKEWGKNRRRYPAKDRARVAVYCAIKSGKIPHPSTLKCDYDGCGKRAKHYHHYMGYEPENRLTVRPLCIEHHNVVHRILGF